MIKVLSICLFIFIIQSKLLQVFSIFRHGARYYLNNYYDGNSSRQLWGQLTAVGMRQQQTLGKMIRTEYIDRINFLSDFYVEDEIDMISTVSNRTIQSARSQLYGLYPLEKGKRIQKVPQNYLIPPYSNSTDSLQQEYALPSGHAPFVVKVNNTVLKNYCKDRALLIKKNIDSQKVIYDEMYITYLPFMKKLGNIFNISSDSMNFSKVADIYDTLTVDRFLGRPFPPNITEQDYINMKHLNQWYGFLQLSYNLSKAINTNKFQRVIQNFDGRIKDSNQKLRWTFISAHDTDIIPMLIGLNFSQINCIEQLYRKGKTQALNCDSSFQYASSIIIQLHSGADQNDQTIKIRKDGKYMYLCETKEYSCIYAKWRQLIKNSFINVDELCNNPVNKQQIESDQSLYAN